MSPPKPPRVSVIVTCFNLGAFLDEALASVDAQTFRDFECFIVDDGSDDETTLTVLAGCERRGIPVLRKENGGLSSARNAGFAASRGAYICHLDADDKLAPSWLEKATRVLDDRPHVAFVSHWFHAFGDESWDWKPEACDLLSLLDVNTVNGAALVRREVVDAVGGFDESLREGCEDWDFWLTAVERGFEGVILPEVLFFYRRRAESMSRQMLRGATYGHILETLVRKHEDSYGRHLPELLTRAQLRLAGSRDDIVELQIEYEERLGPALRRRREETRALREKLERARAAQAIVEQRDQLLADRDRIAHEHEQLAHEHEQLAHEREQLAHERDQLASDRDRLATERDRLARELQTLEQRLIRAEHHIAELRSSKSWRVTAPLRAAYELLPRRASRPEGGDER